jgi:hypothetical protein
MQTARVTVVSEDGETMLLERVTPAQLASEHFRTCLAERIRWAVEDAAAPREEREERELAGVS